MKKKADSIKGCIITPPCGRATISPLSNLLKICNNIFGKVKVVLIYGDYGNDFNSITENNSEVEIYLIRYKQKRNILFNLFYYVLIQFKTLYYIFLCSKKVSVYYFFLADTLILPMVAVKLLGRKATIIMGSNVNKEMALKKDYFAYIFRLFIQANYKLSDRIILYSPNLIKSWGLEKYRDKILIAHEHFIDLTIFYPTKKFTDRSNLIGYIGRLNEEKGILNFIKAIPEILKEQSDLEFLIIGDGPLRDEIKTYISRNNLNEKVKIVGWISHDKLPIYMNELKLAVLPSYTEGLPNIMLEMLACGTPVLATPVGAIPDIIIDGKSGFIMENNSVECLTENIIRVLKCPDIEKVITDAHSLIEREFIFEVTVKRWKNILPMI